MGMTPLKGPFLRRAHNSSVYISLATMLSCGHTYLQGKLESAAFFGGSPVSSFLIIKEKRAGGGTGRR